MEENKYSVSPRLTAPKQDLVIPASTENLLFAQVRYYRDLASAGKGETSVALNMNARGILEAYALLTGCNLDEAREAYHKNEYGGEGLYY